MPSSLYDTFTNKGTLEQRWSNYGMQSSYDAETETLTFTLPEGWTDDMTEEEKRERKEEWCIDDGSVGVDYELIISGPEERERRVEKMQLRERTNDRFEFQTSVFFEPLRGVDPKARVGLELVATVKLARRPSKRLTLVKGHFEARDKLRVIGSSSPGLFFVAEGGFGVFVHFGAKSCITNVAFIGRLADLVEV